MTRFYFLGAILLFGILTLTFSLFTGNIFSVTREGRIAQISLTVTIFSGSVLFMFFRRSLLSLLKNIEEEILSIGDHSCFFDTSRHRGDISGFVLATDDVLIRLKIAFKSLQTQNNRLMHFVNHDYLTGLPNTAFSKSALEEILNGIPVAHFFYIRLLNLSTINNTISHAAGDALILETTERLHKVCFDAIHLGCVEGRKFLVIYGENRSYQSPIEKGEAILLELEKPIKWQCGSVQALTAVGIASYPAHSEDLSDLQENASLAASVAAASSRKCVVYEEFMLENLKKCLEMENAISLAIERDEFVPFFQPKLDIAKGKITGVEALIRWYSPNGLIMPDAFIPLASKNGLIVQITWLMLKKACLHYRWFLEEGFDLSIAVNVPVQVILHTEFMERILCILKDTKMPFDRLEIEITEDAFVADIGRVSKVMEELRGYGIDISVDDFGTGYSSLQYLKEMPFDTMKIDKTFIKDVAENRHDKAIIMATVGLAKALNLRVVVEGVETTQQWQVVKQIGCHELQGYILSKPITADDLLLLLKDWKSNFFNKY